MKQSIRYLLALPAVALSVSVHSAAAQGRELAAERDRLRYATGVVAGVSHFDLAGTGTAGLVGVRVEAETKRWLVVEAALGLFRTRSSVGRSQLYTVPELQLQLQLPSTLVRPYLGAGVGSVFADDGGGARRSVSGSVGARIPFQGTRVDFRTELRLRGIGESFSGASAEWTFGGAYRF